MQQPAQDVRPAFVVQAISGDFVSKKIRYVKEKLGDKTVNVKKEVEVPHKDGFMVFFPRGHSIYVKDRKRLVELGFDKDPDLVDLNSGDVVGKLGIPLAMVGTKEPVKPVEAKGGK